jgi:hypothetical protein
MRKKTLLGLFSLILIVALIGVSVPPTSRVQANNVLQGVPPLNGFQIYYTESQGEASRFDRTDSGLSRLSGLLELLGADQYTLEWRTGIPEDADLLIVTSPTKALGGDQVAWLWAYLQNGGRLLLLAEPPVTGGGFSATKDLSQLMWDDMGLRGRDDVTVLQGELRSVVPPGDTVKKDTPTPTPLPAVEQPSLVSSFLATTINTFHPIAGGVSGDLFFTTVRTLDIDSAPRESQVTPLLYAPEDAYGESDYKTYMTSDFAEYNIGKDTAPGNLVLAAAMEDIATGTRVVLIGDRDFAVNGGGLQTSPPYSGSFLYPGNVRFLLNSITWLLDVDSAVEQITFSTPGPTVTPTLVPSPMPTPIPTEAAE